MSITSWLDKKWINEQELKEIVSNLRQITPDVNNILLRNRAQYHQDERAGNLAPVFKVPPGETWIFWYIGGSNDTRAAEITIQLYDYIDGPLVSSEVIRLPHSVVASGGADEVACATDCNLFPLVLGPETRMLVKCDNGIGADAFTTYYIYTKLRIDQVNRVVNFK